MIKITTLFNINYNSLFCVDYPFCFLISGIGFFLNEIFYVRIFFSLFLSILAFYFISRAQDDIEKKVSTFTLFGLLIIFSNVFVDQVSFVHESLLDYVLFSGLILCLYKDHYFFTFLLASLLFLIKPAYLLVLWPFLVFCLIQPEQREKKSICFLFFGLIVLSWLIFVFYSFGHHFIYVHFNSYIFSYLGGLTFIPFFTCFSFILLNRKNLNAKDTIVIISGLQHLIFKIRFF